MCNSCKSFFPEDFDAKNCFKTKKVLLRELFSKQVCVRGYPRFALCPHSQRGPMGTSTEGWGCCELWIHDHVRPVSLKPVRRIFEDREGTL